MIHAVDLFCGAGGTSQGLARACRDTGVEVDLVAVNHWETAVNTHAQNHPWARHYCVPVESVNPREAFPGGVVHILCASPECTHHSTARGGKPTNDQLRASAWHIMRWVNELDVRNILIENVPEFTNWGPVGQKTGRPVKAQRGRYFRAFIEALSACGYAVQWRVLNAADYGDATSRKRLFVLARKGRQAPEWPAQSHSRVKDGVPSAPGTLPWRSARSIIDWSLEGQSIFDREERGLKPVARKTIERIVKGLERYGGSDLQPFLVLLRGTSSAVSLDGPVPALTAGGTHVGVATPFLLGQQSGGAPRSVNDPTPTISTGGAISVVEPVLVDTFGSKDTYDARAKSTTEPLGTIAGNGRWGVAEPIILPPDGPGGNGEHNHARSVEEPLGTVRATRGAGHVVEPVIVPYNGNGKAASVNAPLPTATTVERFGVAEPFLVPYFGERDGQEPRTHGVDHPLPAVTGQGAGALVEPFLVTSGGPERAPASVDEPTPTLLTRDHLCVVEPHILQLSHGGRTKDIDDPLPTITTAHRGELALVQPVINGRALDIRFRMLQPHELARAMGFGDEYEFVGNKRDVVKQIGNAVAVNMSQALIASLLLGRVDDQSRLPVEGPEAVEVPGSRLSEVED
jgi:DNA (cytosine-5)-methyltransferase 1